MYFQETTATALDPTNHWRYTGTNKHHRKTAFGTVLPQNSEGMAFASSIQNKISLALVAIANPDARRPTSIRYQFFFSSTPITRRACALSFLFFSFSLSIFFFFSPCRISTETFSYTCTFGDQGTKRNINGRKAGLETLTFRRNCTLILVCFWAKLVSRCL